MQTKEGMGPRLLATQIGEHASSREVAMEGRIGT